MISSLAEGAKALRIGSTRVAHDFLTTRVDLRGTVFALLAGDGWTRCPFDLDLLEHGEVSVLRPLPQDVLLPEEKPATRRTARRPAA